MGTQAFRSKASHEIVMGSNWIWARKLSHKKKKLRGGTRRLNSQRSSDQNPGHILGLDFHIDLMATHWVTNWYDFGSFKVLSPARTSLGVLGMVGVCVCVGVFSYSPANWVICRREG